MTIVYSNARQTTRDYVTHFLAANEPGTAEENRLTPAEQEAIAAGFDLQLGPGPRASRVRSGEGASTSWRRRSTGSRAEAARYLATVPDDLRRLVLDFMVERTRERPAQALEDARGRPNQSPRLLQVLGGSTTPSRGDSLSPDGRRALPCPRSRLRDLDDDGFNPVLLWTDGEIPSDHIDDLLRRIQLRCRANSGLNQAYSAQTRDADPGRRPSF